MERRKKIFLRKVCLPAGSVAVLCGLLAAAAAWQSVDFADPGLEAAVRDKLGSPQRPLARTELLQLSRLDASGRNISRLDGIENLRQLVVLDLSNNRVEDLTPLRTLRKLRKLDLRWNGVASLDAVNVRALTHLRSLDLRGNQVTDISPLAGLASLRELSLRENDVADLAPLSGLTGLTRLNIHSNPRIRSLDPLRNLTELTALIMRNVPAGDGLGVLRGLTRLRRLNARNCGIADTAVLADLMAQGVLQNNPKTGEQADVNLLDNPLPGADRDPYLPIRRYWKNIARRSPTDLPYIPGAFAPPAFSRPGGFYGEPFELALSSGEPGAAIFYTLDGSTPTEGSARYTGPAPIKNAGGDLPSGVVVRARAVAPDGRASDVVTNTYFVGSENARRHTLPVVSLSTDTAHFFDRATGIYNYHNMYRTGRAWERPVSIEFYEPDGRLGFALAGGVRIHGGSSRRYEQKALRLYARPDYGPAGAFQCRLFPGLTRKGSGEPLDEFKALILRASGNDHNSTMFRDVLMQGLVEGSTHLETQASRHTILYFNGEYWGLYDLREYYDEHYLAAHYGVSPDRVAILENNAELKRGEPGDRAHYLDLREYAKTHDLSDPEHYRHVTGMMDPQGYIEYCAANIYFHNVDWPHNNVTFWRIRPAGAAVDHSPGHDGRWRWMLQSTDYGFGLRMPSIRKLNRNVIRRFEKKYGSLKGFAANTLKWAVQSRDCRFKEEWPNILFRKLLENEEFRVAFINHLADRLNSAFHPARVIRRIDEIEQTLAPEMEAHIPRWQDMKDMENWRNNVEKLRRFARERPENVRRHFVEHFGLGGVATVTLRADARQGHIRINDLDLAEGTPGIGDTASWTGVYFQDVPVRIAAIPARGFRFAGWEGTDRNEAELTLVLKGDLALTARFERE